LGVRGIEFRPPENVSIKDDDFLYCSSQPFANCTLSGRAGAANYQKGKESKGMLVLAEGADGKRPRWVYDFVCSIFLAGIAYI
jgi:hypothetical protein